MKSKYAIALAISMITLGTFAQKDELKALEKALKSTDDQMIKTSLANAQNVIANGTDVEKSQFYLLKGNALVALSSRSADKGEKLIEAAKSYQEVLELEKKLGKTKFTTQAQTSLATVQGSLIDEAIKDNTAKRFKQGTQKLIEAYNINKQDTIYLYYAANGAINAADYDTALDYYDKLKKLNYSGINIIYYATEKSTGEEVSFDSKSERDLFVRAGSHEKPREQKSKSVRSEVYRNRSLILVEKGNIDEALLEVQTARKLFPKETEFVLLEADFYNRKGDMVNYLKIIKEASNNNPLDADLVYNLGVASLKLDKKEDAINYFNKTIEMKSDYVNAYINLANLKVEEQTKIFEVMEKLGNSSADNKKYNELMDKKTELLKEALPYLEKALSYQNDNLDVLNLMIQIYPALGMDEQYKEVKSKISKIENN